MIRHDAPGPKLVGSAVRTKTSNASRPRPQNAMAPKAIAPKGRQSIATGVSPWTKTPPGISPEGAEEATAWHARPADASTSRKTLLKSSGTVEKTPPRSSRTKWGGRLARVILAVCLTLISMLGSARADDAAQSPPKPLPTKQEIIRDRFQRLEDRMFRLRQQLSQTEPDNADRLGRALERAGGLGLAERLDEISRILAADGRLLEGIDAQQAWLDQVDKVMAILLQRDSDNEQRKDEIARMEEYRERMRTILEQQRAQRDQSARASALRQLRAELDTALDQIEQEIQRQQELAERSGDPQEKEDVAREQAEAARSAEALAEQVERMAESEAREADPQSGESQQSDSAKSEMQKAGEALDSAAESMKQASKSASQGDEESLADEQERAEEALKRARDSLKKAKENLPEDPDLEKMGDEQGKTADATGDLADKMRQDGQPQEGGENQQGQQPSKPSPGTDKVQEAEREMRDAQKDLEDGQPEDAAEEQDRAIEALEEAQQALEDELNQLRKEDRQETLRDLESRFRAMTAKQRAINEGTTELDRVDEASFRRPEQLRAAELAADEHNLAEKAATCLHILEEEGTTIVFPRIVEQLAQDMADVADRLDEVSLGLLTQTMQREVLDTLEQLIEAVQRMQRENEQQQMQQQQAPGDQNAPLLPTSAELKLLRASQLRVNTRTQAIDQTRREKSESVEGINKAHEGASRRQMECTEIAEQMRERIDQP